MMSKRRLFAGLTSLMSNLCVSHFSARGPAGILLSSAMTYALLVLVGHAAVGGFVCGHFGSSQCACTAIGKLRLPTRIKPAKPIANARRAGLKRGLLIPML